MSKEKRTFESDALSLYPLHIKSKSEVEEDDSGEVRYRSSKKDQTFTREVVLRLIEWLEQK